MFTATIALRRAQTSPHTISRRWTMDSNSDTNGSERETKTSNRKSRVEWLQCIPFVGGTTCEEETERVHFVQGSVSAELERLGISRTRECVRCQTETSAAEIGELVRDSPEYRTICVECKEC